jgi:hypothetical protein
MVVVPADVAATVVVHVTVVVAVRRRPLPPSAVRQPRAQEQDRGPTGDLVPGCAVGADQIGGEGSVVVTGGQGVEGAEEWCRTARRP